MRHLRSFTLLAAILLAAAPLTAEEIVKSGWSVGLLPACYYNNDLGFSVGVLGQLFDYGDGTVYPNYRHKVMANVNIYSRGAKQIVFNYDSKYLIPGMRVTADLTYMNNPLRGFYGFNGAAAPYHADLDLKKSADGTEGIAFYANHERYLKAAFDLQGRVADGLTWIGGASYTWQRYSDTAFRVYDGTESLFHQYVENGLIPEADTRGHRTELKGGLVYDTRDFEPNPERGLYATVTATGGMSVSEGVLPSLVISADFRHYVPVVPSRLTLAYQLSCKSLVAGSLPFYALPAFAMRGSFGTRIVGNGVAWASADLRLCVARFHAVKQNFELGLVALAVALSDEWRLAAFRYRESERDKNALARERDVLKGQIDALQRPAAEPESISVKVNLVMTTIRLDDILYVKSDGDYIVIHLSDGRAPMVLMTLKALEKQLPFSRFCRIHRSYLVAIDKVQGLQGGKVLVAGEPLPLSDSCKPGFFELLSHKSIVLRTKAEKTGPLPAKRSSCREERCCSPEDGTDSRDFSYLYINK